jgi:hypothetical protein
MYTLPILTFDTDYSVPYSTDSDVTIANTKPTKSKVSKKSTTPATTIDSKNRNKINNDSTLRSRQSTWDVHRKLIIRFLQIDPAHYNAENYDCFAIYFELMRALPLTRQLVLDIVNSQNRSSSADSDRIYYHSGIPDPSGPTAAIPSRLHASTVHVMETHLQFESSELEVFHEFNGLHGVFAVDSAG